MTFFFLKLSERERERVEVTISEMVGNTELVRGKHRAEMRRPNVPAVVRWREDRCDNQVGDFFWVSAGGGHQEW